MTGCGGFGLRTYLLIKRDNMNRIHDRNLRTLLGVSDAKATISDEAKSRVERMEERMTRFFGHFIEMQAEVLVSIVNDLADDKVFISYEEPKPAKPSPEEYIRKMNRRAVEAELEKRGFELNGKEPSEELRELLLESVKGKRAVEAATE